MNKRIAAVFSVLYLLILTWIIRFKANPGSFHILFDEIASVSLFHEIMQYVLCIGTADITDLISNTSGGAIGLFFCAAMTRQLGLKSKRMLSILACAGTALLVLLTRLTL